MKIYELIRKIRKEKNMTQQELADKVHVTVQAINQYEAGKREIKADMLVSLLQALGYDFSIQETFQDRAIFAIEWDLSFYVEYDNEYGRFYTEFQGAKEISKETYDRLQTFISDNNFYEAAEILAQETRHLPSEGDHWDRESWEQFFEEASMSKKNGDTHLETTTNLDDSDQERYMERSFLTLKSCLLSNIKDVPCRYDRMVYD